MTQIYIDEDGKKHTFPDDATRQEMKDSVSGTIASQKPSSPMQSPFMNTIKSGLSSIAPKPELPFGMNIISGMESLIAPQQAKEAVRNLPQMISGQQTGTQERIAQGIGEYMPMMTSGSNALSGLSGAAARVGQGAALGSVVNPQDRMKGAMQGGEYGLGGELLPGILHSIGKVAETINPLKYTGELMDKIKSNYNSARTDAGNIYNSLKDKYKDSNVYRIYNRKLPSSEYLTVSDESKSFFSPTLKKMNERFINNPTYDNAHDLQSEMANYVRKIGKSNVSSETQNVIEEVSNAREKLNNDLSTFLKNKNKDDHISYERARTITRDVVAPHYGNTLINKIANGNAGEVQPNELLNSLKDITETNSFPKNHYLNDMKQDLSKKVQRGKAINEIGSLITGAGVGNYLMPGASGVGGGLAAGSLASKFVNPTVVSLAQNPYINKILSEFKNPYNILKSGTIGSNLQKN